jgi:tRNA dimethylallyltransferase
MAVYKRQKVVVIAGPTASGKTMLGVELASALGGEIVNADSMQVYRGMDIGTAKPTAEEKKGIVHHLLDVVDPDEEFNAAVYRSMALPLIKDIDSRGKVPLIVGGTGLYIKGLLGGLFECAPSDQDLRDSLHRELGRNGSRSLHRRLKSLDPESAKSIHPNDGIRIIRALEIIEITSRMPSDLYREHGFSDREIDALKIYLDVDRTWLYSRINDRCLAMKDAGLVEETEALLKQGYSPELKAMKAIGYRHMIEYLQGSCSLDEAVCFHQRDTRRYAKRQLTWFRSDPEADWVAPGEVDVIIEKTKAFYDL